MLNPEQKAALAQLLAAIHVATDTALFDEMMGYVNHPDSINDVCDAAAAMRED